MKKYVCSICGYVYDEAAGIPAAGIGPGTRWEDLPEGWVCPLCGASKDLFNPVEPQKRPENGTVKAAGPETVRERDGGEEARGPEDGSGDEELRELSAGELSALCSNLARGCEKQYRAEESALFTQLADYFKAKTPVPESAELSGLLERVGRELNVGFPQAEAAAKENGDRGAQRALVWSGKVTRILDALLKRWEKEGEAMLEHTNLYVCDICGFVYVGDNPPELCPVCKVPGWKFSQIERRA